MLRDIKDFAVKIETPWKVGTGILYASERYQYAYIFTVAHVFTDVKQEFDVKILFNAGQGKNRGIEKECSCIIRKPGDVSDEKLCKVCILEGFDFDSDDSPNDGAVIRIPYEKWMYGCEYEIGKACEDSWLEGWGAPKDSQEMDKFCCQVVSAAGDRRGRMIIEDYIVGYNSTEYKEVVSTDTDFLDGFSGTGLFRRGENKLAAIFSRDVSGSKPRLYLTDAVRLRELMDSMEKLVPIIFPLAEYVPYDNRRGSSPEKYTMDLDDILDCVYENKHDYFRIICGYMWSGKTYAIEMWQNYNAHVRIVQDWNEIMDCLNEERFSEYKDSVFVLDQLERIFLKEEKSKIFCGGQYDNKVETGRLYTDEKTKLYEKIENFQTEFEEYHITLFFICRSNFFMDMEECLEEEDGIEKRIFRNRLIFCKGLGDEKKKEAVSFYSYVSFPDYFPKIPFVTHQLQWLAFIKQRRNLLPESSETSYRYEFRLYREVIENICGNKMIDPTICFLKDREESDLEKYVWDYIRRDLNKEYLSDVKRDKNESIFFWCYPVVRKEGNFKLDDEILYSYLVARALFQMRDSEREFLNCFLRVYRIAMDLSEETGMRIKMFLWFLCEEGDAEKKIQECLLSWTRYEKCAKWFFLRDENQNKLLRDKCRYDKSQSLNSIDFMSVYILQNIEIIISNKQIIDQVIDMYLKTLSPEDVKSFFNEHFKEYGNYLIRTLKE